MGLFSRSFDKPGPGVDPDAPKKRGFFRFFELVVRKFWNFTKLSPMYVVFLLPIYILYFLTAPFVLNLFSVQTTDSIAIMFFGYLTANLMVSLFGGGPVTAGMTYIMRNYANEEHAWIWSDFKDNAKSNFKQALVVFLVDLVMLALFYVAIMVYSSLGGNFRILKYLVFVLLFVYIMMHFYIYPMMVTFKLSLKDLYKNAVLFAIAKLPLNLFVVLVLVLLHIALPVWIILSMGKFVAIAAVLYVILEVLLFQGISIFLTNFAVAKTIKETMLDRANEE